MSEDMVEVWLVVNRKALVFFAREKIAALRCVGPRTNAV